MLSECEGHFPRKVPLSGTVNLWNKIGSIPFSRRSRRSHMARVFRDHNINQPMLFAPDVRDWLSDGSQQWLTDASNG